MMKLLKQKFDGQSLIVFIEEIPINGEGEFEEFASKLFSLISSKKRNNWVR